MRITIFLPFGLLAALAAPALPAAPESASVSGAAVPKIAGPYVHVYAPGAGVFPGPDSEHFKTGQSYAEWVPNDHAILKGADGRWHALGITHPKPPDDQAFQTGNGVHEAEWLLFHAIAPPGRLKVHLQQGDWLDAGKVLAPGDRPGEVKPIYAPFVVLRDGVYHMIYGPDPMRWRLPATWIPGSPRARYFTRRVERVIPASCDKAIGIFCIMWRAIRYGHVPQAACVAGANRPWRSFPCGAAAPESPSVVERDGQFYLFWCLWDAADKVNGCYDNRTFVFRSAKAMDFRDAPCVAQLQAHAPEVFRDEDGDWFISSVEWPKRGVSIAPLVWK